jgi:hypothetical protein
MNDYQGLFCHRKLRDFLRPNILDTTKFITCAVSTAIQEIISMYILNQNEKKKECITRIYENVMHVKLV